MFGCDGFTSEPKHPSHVTRDGKTIPTLGPNVDTMKNYVTMGHGIS